jgi:hypothetical protein
MTNEKGTTIFQRLEKKIDDIGEKAQKDAEKKVRRERIMEMARAMDFWEKLELHIKIGL